MKNPSNKSKSVPIIRTIVPSEWELYRKIRLRALKDSPDAFGSTFEREVMIPDDGWQRRLSDNTNPDLDLPLFAEVDGEPVGLAWGRINRSDPKIANLYQMWVAPEHRGLGIGRMLVDAVISWARERSAEYLDLGVTCGDTPARRLYERAGFVPSGIPEPLRPGSEVLCQFMLLTLIF
ncbi:MAG: GNAT family N-acetyltransferase [Chloroflexi bacterium]|nr:MAG: GNAT family N-acetyltransferase [Chloroflexota bacterium]